MNEYQKALVKLLVILVVELNGKVEQLSTAVETLEAAVNGLEVDEGPLKESVEEAVTHLASLEAEVKQLQEAGTLTPQKAEELAAKINNVANAVTVATTSLKGV